MDDFDAPALDSDSPDALDPEPEVPVLEPADKPTLLPAPRPGKAPKLPKEEHLPSVDSLQGQVYVLTAAQQTMFQRVDQLAKLLEQEYAQSQSLRQETMDTLKLWQESFQAVDQLADKLARIAAALVKLYQLDLEQQNQGIFS